MIGHAKRISYEISSPQNPNGYDTPMEFTEGPVFERFRYTRPGVLVDVGAHKGYFCEPMVARGWRTVAFEPHPDLFATLERAYRDNPRVTVIQRAIADAPGEMPFYTSAVHPGIHSLAPFDASHRKSGTVAVSTLTAELDLLGITTIAALKIDVEGADLMALRGFDFTRRRPELVMVEFMDDRSREHFGYTHHDMASLMIGHGYAAYVSEWAPLNGYGDASQRWRSLHRYRPGVTFAPNVWGNLLFVAPRDGWKLRLAAAEAVVRLNARRTGLARRARGTLARLGA